MKKWYRSRVDQKLGGVVGGLSKYFEVDPNILRLFTLLLCFVTGIVPVVITYFIAWAIVPLEPEDEPQAAEKL
jgi:phage shock protein PspC (stress-responsive transcriptional regulator)